MGLILAAVAMAFVKQTALLPIVFGSLGMADVLAYFVTSPPRICNSAAPGWPSYRLLSTTGL